MAAGGGNVDSERIASLETKMDMVLETVREIKRDVVTKAEHSALNERVTKLENSRKEMLTTVLSIASVIVAIWAVVHK